ncbi:MAG TPA: hypothetical protein VFY05_01010 [Candidatus Angelobacter sp.]|nr:hypothetical protein [Candidatus Angelobacter sp.]
MPVLAFGVLAGCRSRVVEVKLVNASPQPLSTIIVDYPSATFGVDKLNPGVAYQYPIKPLATGSVKVQFTDAHGHNHTFTGPALHKNDEGALTVTLTQDSATTSSDYSQR